MIPDPEAAKVSLFVLFRARLLAVGDTPSKFPPLFEEADEAEVSLERAVGAVSEEFALLEFIPRTESPIVTHANKSIEHSG